jgi:hypothetical protein
MADVETVIDTKALEALRAQIPGRVLLMLKKLGFDLTAYISEHFSDSSPSSPGEAPGVDTGLLKNSQGIQQTGDAEVTWSDNVPYGIDLEFGTVNMAARPFVLPAVDAIQKTIPDVFSGLVSGVVGNSNGQSSESD